MRRSNYETTEQREIAQSRVGFHNDEIENMDRITSNRKISPLWLLIAVLGLIAALYFIGIHDRDHQVGVDSIPRMMARKMEVVSALRIKLLKSVEAEKSSVMADTDEASIALAEESLRTAEAGELDRQELAALIAKYPSGPEKDLLQEFDSCWREFRKIDQQVLEFAVQNTNLKAARLSFGAASTAMNEFGHALSELISDSAAGPVCRRLYDAHTAALRIQVLHAPHIASPDDHEMDGIEKVIRQNDAVVRRSLSEARLKLPPEKRLLLQKAEAAYDAFMEFTGRVLEWSRQNTNVKSFEISLNRKRKITAQCEDVLESLEDAVQSRTFKATR